MPEEVAAKAFDWSVLTKTKVAGVPLIGVLAAAGVLWYVIKRRQAGSSGTSGQQIDSAGNVGSIDPSTGYVYGSLQDRTALAQSSAGSQDTSTSSTSSATTAGQYATNAAWANAAVNYLVGLGVDPTVATQAIQNYLESQTLSTNQQGEVNLAIQALGPPPTLPEPTQNQPTPINTPGGGASATNPVTGLAVGHVTSTTVGLSWSAAQNATGYTVSYGLDPSASTWTTTAPGGGSGVTSGQVAHPGITIGNLNPQTTYYFKVQATPVGATGGWAGPISAKTTR